VIFSTKPSLLVTASRNEQGMTLIELLASLSLLAILLVVLSQFLYTSVHLWGKNDHAYERRHQLRLISQTLNTDLGLLVNSPFLPEPAIRGDEYDFTFWAATNDGLVQVKYHFDSQEQKVFRSEGFWGSKPAENLLLDQVKEWKVEYYRPKTKNWDLQWQPAPTLKNDIPSLIKVTITVGKNSLGSLVFPIKAWHKASDGEIDGT
jgi:prepilin-type N-terminal cleavage/methylation domain-containing protein